jgi:hypothetical protein
MTAASSGRLIPEHGAVTVGSTGCGLPGRTSDSAVPEVSLVSVRRWVPVIVGAMLVTLLSPLTAIAQATADGVTTGAAKECGLSGV